MSDVKHVKVEEHYEVTVRMTPEEYAAISNNAAWNSGGSISSYLIKCALNYRSPGC